MNHFQARDQAAAGCLLHHLAPHLLESKETSLKYLVVVNSNAFSQYFFIETSFCCELDT